MSTESQSLAFSENWNSWDTLFIVSTVGIGVVNEQRTNRKEEL
jgi:hypothetical protein